MKQEKLLHLGSLTAVIFTIIVACLSLAGYGYGEYAAEISTLYTLGSKGLSFATIIQVFIVSFLAAATETLIFSSVFFKHTMTYKKNILILFIVFFILAAAILLFRWFPINFYPGWGLFILCYGISSSLSIALAMVRMKNEDRLLAEKLQEYRTAHSEETV